MSLLKVYWQKKNRLCLKECLFFLKSEDFAVFPYSLSYINLKLSSVFHFTPNTIDCDPSNCRLPDCFCAGRVIPHGLPASSTPQMVMLTFDDEVSPTFYGFYNRLFRPGRYNPNGCPVIFDYKIV